jgi:hypothetical protein
MQFRLAFRRNHLADARVQSIRSASIGLKFAASLAGRYPNNTPTPQETTSATKTAVQEILMAMVFWTHQVADQIIPSAISTPTTAPAKLMKKASSKN